MKRSKRIVFVSHSLLNQNAMPIGREKYAGVVKELVELLSESEIGIVQMPCPHISFNGALNRSVKTKDKIDTAPFRKHCKKTATNVINQIELYMKNKYKVVGILGVEFSPTEAVYQIHNGNRTVPGKGILTEELEDQMRKKRFQIPIVGVNLNNIFSSMERVQSMLSCA
jgi:predicted secreted protein